MIGAGAPALRQRGLMSDSVTTTERPVTCVRLRAGEPFVGKQGFTYAAAISAETAGASAIHMQLLTVPPGARAKAHKHEAHETALYVLSGEVGMYYGEKLESHMVARAGDFVYIPAKHAAPALQPEPDRAGDSGDLAHRAQRAGKRRHAARTGRSPPLGHRLAIARWT